MGVIDAQSLNRETGFHPTGKAVHLKSETAFGFEYMARSKSLHVLSGRLGVEPGMQQNNTGIITEDNDGEIPDGTYNWTIDLSHLLSRKLGRQMSMMANYRVKGMRMSLRNVNNAIDNDAALQFGGLVRWYTPTAHRVDALQYAREYKRDIARAGSLTDSGDPFAPWDNENHYRGFRFNWNADSQLDVAATTDETSVLDGSYFALDEILFHYNDAKGGTPAEEGRPTTGEGASLWTYRTGYDEFDSLYFNTAYTNRIQTSGFADDGEHHAPSFQEWAWDAGDSNHIDVLGGLLRIIGVHSNTDTAGILEDEYWVQYTIIVEGWEEF